MRRFLINLSLFLALQGILLSAILSTTKVDPGAYYASICDKERLLARPASRRVILLGGSSIAYTLDSARVERELRLSPVNLGVSMHLGLDYILKEVPISKLRRGDIVVLNLEYEHFCSDPLRVSDVFNVLKAWPASVLLWNGHTAKRMLDEGLAIPTLYLTKVVESFSKPHKAGVASEANPYRRNAFNRFGDGVGQLDLAASLTDDVTNFYGLSTSDPELQTSIRTLNVFCGKCGAKGVAVVFLYPAYPDCLFHYNNVVIDNVRGELERRLHIPILNTPEESIAPVDWFYDNPYHLKRNGVEWRTTSVIAQLRKEMDVLKSGRSQNGALAAPHEHQPL